MSRAIDAGKTALSDKEWALRDTSQGKLVITEVKNKYMALLLKNHRLTAACPWNLQGGSLLGGIYVARIRSVVDKINACFVEALKGQVCFLALNEIQPWNILNRREPLKPAQGDLLLVEVIKDAQKTKYPTAAIVTYGKQYSKEQVAEWYERAAHRTAFSCIRQGNSQLKTMLDHYIPENQVGSIVTDSRSIYEECQAFYNKGQADNGELPGTAPELIYYDSEKEVISLNVLYGLSSKLDTALESHVWLKSGAYLIIEQTETCTVIDVNSGKYEGKSRDMDYYYTINLEAAEEIALQLRLRNLSGMILVDFINLKNKDLENRLLEAMRELVREDPVTTICHDITKLGLMEITRKKHAKSLKELLLERVGR